MRSARRGAHATAGVHATAGARTIMRDRLAHAAGGYDDSFGKQIIDPRSKLAVPASDTSACPESSLTNIEFERERV